MCCNLLTRFTVTVSAELLAVAETFLSASSSSICPNRSSTATQTAQYVILVLQIWLVLHRQQTCINTRVMHGYKERTLENTSVKQVLSGRY